MKIPKRHFSLVMATLMGTAMSLVMSFVMTLVNLGWTPSLWQRWPKMWGIAWVVAVPTAIVLLPRMRRIAEAVTE